MTVKSGSIERSLNRDWYMGHKTYLEVEMSYSQFAEAITAMNIGDGVPVTLRYLNGERISNPEFTNKRLQFENEIQERINTLNNTLKKLTEDAEDILTNKKSLNKSDRESIISQIKMLRQEVNSNIPFVMTSFNEQMDKTVSEAKGEIEAFTQNKLHSLGLEKLEDLKLLNKAADQKLIESE
jgi:paraquat-inducible protein B